MLNDKFIQNTLHSLEVEVLENNTFTTVSGFPEYKVGPNDLLKISIWEGRTLKEYTVRVQVDGTISFAYTTDMYIKDLTPTQIRRKIIESSKEFYKRPNVNVDVLEYNAKKASILGQERDLQRSNTGPGQYPLNGKTYIVDFISLHGGPTDKADLAQVKVVRANGRTFYLNLYNAMFEGDIKQNIILDDGDVVYIPLLEISARKFYVLGEVKNPGIYELKDEVNILEAIVKAGGFTDRASFSSVAVIRGDLTRPEVAIVNIEKLIRSGDQSENIEIRDKDIIYVSRHFIGDINYVLGQIVPSLNTLFLIERLR
jgi:polysaccharide export outer membrane protein